MSDTRNSEKKTNTISKQIHPQLPQKDKSKSKEAATLEKFREAWLQMQTKRQIPQNSYEKVITAL